jgi:hypothetical protein
MEPIGTEVKASGGEGGSAGPVREGSRFHHEFEQRPAGGLFHGSTCQGRQRAAGPGRGWYACNSGWVSAASSCRSGRARHDGPAVDQLIEYGQTAEPWRGRLVGIVSRGDLLKVHLRPDDEILADVESGIVRPFLSDETKSVQAEVAGGIVTFTGRVERWSTIDLVDRLARQIPGVVGVVDKLAYDYDDRNILGTGIAFGVA